MFSCSSKDNSKSSLLGKPIEVTLDTVLVDSGDEFLYLQDNLWMSSVSPDQDYFFNFNRKELKAEKINLNTLQLEKTIQFEKDGPEKLGQYVSSFSALSNGNLLFWTYQFSKEYNQEGKIADDWDLAGIASDYLQGNEYYPMTLFEVEQNAHRVIALMINWEDNTYFLLDMDRTDQSFEVIELPDLNKASEYKVDIIYDGNVAGSYGIGAHTGKGDGVILINTHTFNELMVYDLNADSLFLKKWDSPLIGSQRSYHPPKEADGATGELREIVKSSEEDITYNQFLWDPDHQRYFRFSEKKKFGEELNEFGEYVVTGAEVFLSVFDSDFNLVQESLIPELTQSPAKHFVKDGQIWIYENVEDELGFVRVSLAGS